MHPDKNSDISPPCAPILYMKYHKNLEACFSSLKQFEAAHQIATVVKNLHAHQLFWFGNLTIAGVIHSKQRREYLEESQIIKNTSSPDILHARVGSQCTQGYQIPQISLF